MWSRRKFLNINLATIVSVYILILIGAIVRSQGAGMGCPDWPKCFGAYVPPSTTEALPSNYEELFLSERLEKNARLAKILDGLGLSEWSYKVKNDPNILITEPFDYAKAWTEYVNRLVGVTIGLFVFINMIFSFSLRKEDVWLPVLGIFIFILTGFQGWVGALVVSTNLLPGFITFHMVLALLIVVLLIWMRTKSIRHDNWMVTRKMKWILGIFAFLMMPQIVFGSLTREQVDVLLDSGVLRSMVPDQLTGVFFLHRSYSWLLVIMTVVAYFKLRKNGFHRWPRAIVALVGLEILLGVSLAWFGFPLVAQPLHLLVAMLLFGGLFYLFLRVKTVAN